MRTRRADNSSANDESEGGIELLPTQAAKNKKPLVQATMSDIPAEAFPRVRELLGERSWEGAAAKKPFKIYSMFYVDPMSKWTGIWDFVLIFIVYFFQVEISLLLAFGPDFWRAELGGKVGFIIGYVVELLFLCADVVICFHKGYYAFGRGRVVDDHQKIIQHYLKIHFPIDIAAILLLLIPLFSSHYFLNYLQLVPAVLLYIKKAKNQREILDILQYNRTFRNFIELTLLGCDVMLMGHYGACIFVGLDLLLWRLKYYGGESAYYWLSNDSSYSVDLMDGPWILQYVFAQSFSTGTLSTLAPGPFGKNPIEIFYAIVLMTFFMILASYVGEVLVSILYSSEETRIFHENNIQRFDQFMKLKGVSARIKQRVHNFFELIWEVEGKISADKQKQVLEKLPLTLKEALLMEMGFARHLKLFQFFTNGQVIQRYISFKITNIVVDSETALFFSGVPPAEIDQRYLFYIKSGLCKFFQGGLGRPEQIFALSNMQKTVGQLEFVTGLSYCYSCRSIDLCAVDRIANSDLISIIAANGILEEYHVLKYRLLIENELFLISKVCIICEGNHTENRCTELYPAEAIRDKLRRAGGIVQNQRKGAKRRSRNSGKVMRARAHVGSPKAMVPLVWSQFSKLGSMVMELSKLGNAQMEEIFAYRSYYPEFNIENK